MTLGASAREAGWLGSLGTIDQSAYAWPLHVAWASAQHGSCRLVSLLTSYMMAWGSKNKCSREQIGSLHSLYLLSVTSVILCGVKPSQICPDSKGGDIDSTSQWEEC